MTPDELFDAVMALPDDDRYELIERLYETMPDPLDDDFIVTMRSESGEPIQFMSLNDPRLLDELDRRAADIADAAPWERVRDER